MARTAAHANDARRRPRLRHVIIAMALTGSVVVAGTGGSTGAGAAEPVRYLDRVFDAVDLTSDLTYLPADGPGSWPMLLDVLEPHGDPATARPVVIWLHGYGDASWDKASPLDTEIITRFVRHGAVVVSINYGLGDASTAEYRGHAQAAVAWVRANAARFRIDTGRIALAGISAGAYRSLHATYDPVLADGEPPAENRVHAVLSFAGVGPTDTFEAGEPPLFMAHGELDVNAPYANAVASCEAARDAGVPCEFHAYAGADHFGLFAHADELEALAAAWLYEVLDLADAQNPPLPPTSGPPATVDTVPIVPGPPVTSGEGPEGPATTMPPIAEPSPVPAPPPSTPITPAPAADPRRGTSTYAG